jgi:hypothetical protein
MLPLKFPSRRELWYKFAAPPGTLRALARASWRSATTGAPFQVEWPSAQPVADSTTLSCLPRSAATANAADPLPGWHITAADLEFYKDNIERGDGAPWEELLRREWDTVSYVAYRRQLPSGKTEYKSVTMARDSSAAEFMDFYLDDDTRPKWDSMITEHELLENGDPSHRCQIVRWVRTFPFAFVRQREYVLARRLFREPDGSLYGITRTIEHPDAPRDPNMVRMEAGYSMWRSRTVPCPWGSSAPACETVLLHFEDFRIPEHLARFAVRHGMAGFVKKMVPYVPAFVAERRTRAGPFEDDPGAYGLAAGAGRMQHVSSQVSVASAATREEAGSVRGGPEDSASDRSGATPRSPSVRRLGLMLLASGVAVAVASRTAASSGRTGTNKPHHNHHGRGHKHGADRGAPLHHIHSHKIARLSATRRRSLEVSQQDGSEAIGAASQD